MLNTSGDEEFGPYFEFSYDDCDEWMFYQCPYKKLLMTALKEYTKYGLVNYDIIACFPRNIYFYEHLRLLLENIKWLSLWATVVKLLRFDGLICYGTVEIGLRRGRRPCEFWCCDRYIHIQDGLISVKGSLTDIRNIAQSRESTSTSQQCLSVFKPINLLPYPHLCDKINAIWREAFGQCVYADSDISHPSTQIMVMFANGQPVGALLMLEMYRLNELFVRGVAVDKRFRGQGIGTRLVTGTIQHIRSSLCFDTVTLRIDTPILRGFYERCCGMKKVNSELEFRKDFFREDEDQLLATFAVSRRKGGGKTIRKSKRENKLTSQTRVKKSHALNKIDICVDFFLVANI